MHKPTYLFCLLTITLLSSTTICSQVLTDKQAEIFINKIASFYKKLPSKAYIYKYQLKEAYKNTGLYPFLLGRSAAVQDIYTRYNLDQRSHIHQAIIFKSGGSLVLPLEQNVSSITVSNLKNKITAEYGFPIQQQHLYLHKEGNELQDDRVLNSHDAFSATKTYLIRYVDRLRVNNEDAQEDELARLSENLKIIYWCGMHTDTAPEWGDARREEWCHIDSVPVSPLELMCKGVIKQLCREDIFKFTPYLQSVKTKQYISPSIVPKRKNNSQSISARNFILGLVTGAVVVGSIMLIMLIKQQHQKALRQGKKKREKKGKR